jgi:Holliday junction resolvasome RuvABC DNA-binding subunit
MQGLKEASVEAITKVPGIGKKSAEKIYQALRDGS